MDNSLNYSILKFQYDQAEIRIKRLNNGILGSNIRIENLKSKIERNLGFSLNDDDAIIKLNQLSEIIEIPDIIYQYTS